MTGEITRHMVLDAAAISEEIIIQNLDGKITRPPKMTKYRETTSEYESRLAEYNEYKNRYLKTVRDELINNFKQKYKASPCVIMKNVLETYKMKHEFLRTFKITPQPYWVKNKLHSYTWACISPTKKKPMDADYSPHSYLPQLHILICHQGIQFGFSYGTGVILSSSMWQLPLYKKLQKQIFEILKNKENNICIIDGQGPEDVDLPNSKTIASIKELSDIPKNWVKRPNLIGYYYNNKMPIDIHDRIINTLDLVLPIYKDIWLSEY